MSDDPRQNGGPEEPTREELRAQVVALEKALRRAERRVARVEDIAQRSHESSERHRKLILDAHAELSAQADRAEAAARTKSAFLANMSHEIRTPMNGILGMLELLRNAHLDDTERHYLDTAFSAARGLLGLLDDVLDYSKIEAGQMSREIIELDVDALVEDQCGLMSAVAARRGLTVVSIIAPGVPRTVRGAGRHLRQILSNLLSNAVKFTEVGNVTAEVSWVAEVGARGHRHRHRDRDPARPRGPGVRALQPGRRDDHAAVRRDRARPRYRRSAGAPQRRLHQRRLAAGRGRSLRGAVPRRGHDLALRPRARPPTGRTGDR